MTGQGHVIVTLPQYHKWRNWFCWSVWTTNGRI